MAKLNINMSGMGGLSQFPSQSLRNAYAVKDGAVLEGEYNPFIRYGYISPSTSTVTSVTLDQTQAGVMKAVFYDAENDDFYMADDSQIFKGDTTTDLTLTRSVQYGGAIIRDLEVYQINSAKKLFVVYQTGANKLDVGISNLPYDSTTDDPTWLSATTSGGFSTDLVGDAWIQVADNGFAYLLAENAVYKIDGTSTGGTNGTVSIALTFPAGYKMVDSIDYKGYLFIGVHSYSFNTRETNPAYKLSGRLDIGVYIWNRSTVSADGADWIPLAGYREIKKIFVAPNGKVRIIAIDDSGYTDMLEYSGSSFQPIFKIGFDAYSVFRDSVTTFSNMITWFGHDGVLYMYGALNPGDAEGLYKIYHLSTVTSTTGGVILSSPGTGSTAPGLYLTAQVGGPSFVNYRLRINTTVSQAGADVTAANTITFPLKYIPKLSTLNFIRIFGVPSTTTGATTIANIGIYFNQANISWAVKPISLDKWSRGYIDIPVQKQYVNSIQLDIQYVGGLTIGTSDFAPVYAEVDYTPTETDR